MFKVFNDKSFILYRCSFAFLNISFFTFVSFVVSISCYYSDVENNAASSPLLFELIFIEEKNNEKSNDNNIHQQNGEKMNEM